MNDRVDERKSVSALVSDDLVAGIKRERGIDKDIQALIHKQVEKSFKRFKGSHGKNGASAPKSPAPTPTTPGTPRTKEYTMEQSKKYLVSLIKRKFKLKADDKDGSNAAAMRTISNKIKGLKHIQLTDEERPKPGDP